MVRYIFALLLTNTFYCSLGYPANVTTYGPLAKSLQLLGNNCKNPFLVTQITKNLDACNISLSQQNQTSEKELECLIFYDINSQLCSAIPALDNDMNQTYIAKVLASQTVESTCNASKNWKFTTLTEYPMYDTYKNIFKNTVKCLKACGVDELISEETNFYCKYFQWGSELLQQRPEATSPLTGEMASASHVEKPTLLNNIAKPENGSSIPTSTNNAISPNVQNSIAVVSHEAPTKVVTTANTTTSSTSNLVQSDIIPPSSSENVGMPVDNPLKTKLPVTKDSNTKANKVETAPPNNLDGGLPNQNNDNGIVKDFGEYSDSYDQSTLEGLPNNEGNDFGPEPDPKIEDKPKGPQNDYYSNRMEDAYVVDDDHFFSFFLTAIILVVFLYVLYHNKSKFRKVFLGLLVEGRQSGRRRNSRGHEYRRIDTLEQVMSTNSAAPPSKIIY